MKERGITDGLTMNQLAERNAEHVTTIAALEARCAELAAENAGLKAAIDSTIGWQQSTDPVNVESVRMLVDIETPATDAFLAEVRAQAHKEGAYFVANRMLAAWDAGFIDDTAKNAADIARMILTSTEFMADAPEGDFDRSFADGVIEDIAAQLRKGVQS
ncbi:ead/Ea22-like family protein [Salmonella enterica subsp. enterica serovar Teko]